MTSRSFSPTAAAIVRRVPTVLVLKRSNRDTRDDGDDDGDQLVPDVSFEAETKDDSEGKSHDDAVNCSTVEEPKMADDDTDNTKDNVELKLMKPKKPKRKQAPRLS